MSCTPSDTKTRIALVPASDQPIAPGRNRPRQLTRLVPRNPLHNIPPTERLDPKRVSFIVAEAARVLANMSCRVPMLNK